MTLNLLAMPVLLVSFTLGMAGCGTYSSKESAPKESASIKAAGSTETVTQAAAETAIAGAKAAIAESKKIGNEWSNTDDLMKEAVETLAKSDYAKVVELANTAKAQAEHAIAQAKSEKARLN